MSEGMNVYIAVGRHSEIYNGRCYKTTDWTEIVVCNTESEALGLILEKYKETSANDWEIETVNRDAVVTNCLSQDIWEA